MVAISSSVGLSAVVSISVGSDWRTSRQSLYARGFADYIWLVYILVFVGPTSASCYIEIVGLILCILLVKILFAMFTSEVESHFQQQRRYRDIHGSFISRICIGHRAALDHHQFSDRGIYGIVTLLEFQFTSIAR